MITIDDTLKKLDNIPPRGQQSIDERKFFSEISSALFTGELEERIADKSWVEGIILAATMLDFAGKTRLIWIDNVTDLRQFKKIDKLTLEKVIEKLRDKRIITDQQFAEINRIRKARNEAAHDLIHQVLMSRQKQPNPKVESDIKSAIKLLEQLFSA